MTDSAPSPTPVRPALPADPVQYDAVRNEHARKRGLAAPYIAGGIDPELDETLERERPYLRWLIWMVVAIVAGGFLLGIVTTILGIPI